MTPYGFAVGAGRGWPGARNATRCLFVLVVACSAAGAAAQSTAALELTADLSVVSDVIYHGASETVGASALGGVAELQLGKGVYAGVNGHFSDASSSVARRRAVGLYAGHTFEPVEDWIVDSSVRYRRFPTNSRWNYLELGLFARHAGGLGVGLDFAQDYFGRDVSAWIPSVSYEHTLSRSLYIRSLLGATALDPAVCCDAVHALLGVGFARGRWNVDVAWHWNSADRRERFGEPLRSPQLVFSLNVRAF